MEFDSASNGEKSIFFEQTLKLMMSFEWFQTI